MSTCLGLSPTTDHRGFDGREPCTRGEHFANDIKIKLEVPEGLQITGVKGPTEGTIQDRTVYFAPLQKLAPRADAIYRVKIKGHKGGDFRVQVQAEADTLKSPVTEQESTKVYQD